MKHNSGHVFQFLISVIGTVGISLYLENPHDFLNLIIFALLLFLVKNIRLKTPVSIPALFFSLILSTILVIGKQLDLSGAIIWTFFTLIKILMFSLAIFPVTYHLIKWLDSYCPLRSPLLTKKHKLIIFLVFFTTNFLLWLALYPGIYGWDSSAHAYQFFYGDLTSHWSVFLGFVFSRILIFGRDVLGSLSAGVALSTFLQLVLMSLIYTKIVLFIHQKFRNNYFTLSALLLFTLVLTYGLMTVYTTQDTIFGGLFALTFIELYNAFTEKSYWRNKKTPLKFILFSFLMCLCRNNGVYALLVVVVSALIFTKRNKLKTTLIIAIPIILSFVFSGPVLKILNIPKVDTINEMMSIPSQQFAKVYNESQKLTAEEKSEIDYFYDTPGKLELYKDLPLLADRTKETLNATKISENPLRYFSLWIRLGISHPRSYLEAFLLNTLGTWYPNKYYYDARNNYHPYCEYRMSAIASDWPERPSISEMQINRESKFPLLEKALSALITSNKWRELPILSTLYSVGIHFIILIFTIILYIHQKRKNFLVPLSLIIGLYLTIFLGPVSVFRYCYPIALVSPILISSLFCRRN
ncbi:MAG: DUF6020 family protein [Candidatus Saccharibacteria bacterium]|nr:DUF6020 family protein [Candidatus Saccharibacteria bacterium]